MESDCLSDQHRRGSASSLNATVPTTSSLAVSPGSTRKVSAYDPGHSRTNGLRTTLTPFPSAATSSSGIFSDSESDRRDPSCDRESHNKSSTHVSWFSRLSISRKFSMNSKKHDVSADGGVRAASANSNGSKAALDAEERHNYTMRWDVQRGLPFFEPVTCVCPVEPGVIAAGSSDKVSRRAGQHAFIYVYSLNNPTAYAVLWSRYVISCTGTVTVTVLI